MQETTNWNQLYEEYEMAYFRADLALRLPQSYSIEEKAEICDQMAASTAAVDGAMTGFLDQRAWLMFSRVTRLGSLPGLKISMRSSKMDMRM